MGQYYCKVMALTELGSVLHFPTALPAAEMGKMPEADGQALLETSPNQTRQGNGI
jgi:hypothetical protein